MRPVGVNVDLCLNRKLPRSIPFMLDPTLLTINNSKPDTCLHLGHGCLAGIGEGERISQPFRQIGEMMR